MRNLIKSLLDRTPYVVMNRKHRRGLYLLDDLRDLLQGSRNLLFLDVGADEGQTAMQLHRTFPQAVIHSFEPGRDAFQQLRSKVGGVPEIHSHNIALGSMPGTAALYLQEWSQFNSLLPGLPGSPRGTEDVNVTTIDAFCAANKITEISFLKTDTEGFDREVIAGADEMLSRGCVNLIYSEIGVRRDDRRHTSLTTLLSLLEPHGYHLFALYDPPWRRANPDVEFFNALFVRDKR